MRKSLTISIPKPCHENWDVMTPKDKGRHCQLCEKTVYDFSNKTDEHIVKTFEQNSNLCGRFKNQQLDREMVLRRKDKNNYASIAASGLFAFLALGTHDAKAQGEPQIVQTESIRYDSIKGKTAISVLKEKMIKGTIVDESNIPLPGTNVIVKGTTRGVQSDFDGNFAIKVEIGETLVLSYVGFKTQEIKIANKSTYNLKLVMDEDILGEMVIVGGIVSADYKPSYVYTPEELEKRKKREFREQNGYKFYKRKLMERRNKIRRREIKRTGIGRLLYKITNVFRTH